MLSMSCCLVYTIHRNLYPCLNTFSYVYSFVYKCTFESEEKRRRGEEEKKKLCEHVCADGRMFGLVYICICEVFEALVVVCNVC